MLQWLKLRWRRVSTPLDAVQKSSTIQALGIASLPEAEQAAILEKANQRLEQVVIRVLVENLSDQEAREMQTVLKEGKNLEDAIAQIALGVPQLAGKIEYAVRQEIERLRAVLNG